MSIQPHVLFEWLGYALGGAIYWRTRDLSTQPQDSLQRLAIVAGAVAGAAFGSKLIYILDYWTMLQDLPRSAWLGGKTVVGGLLFGVFGVELAKKYIGWHRSTGDSFVWPVLAGLFLARLGCQFSGGQDLTYGIPTSLPWGWDYGDGIARHPTAFYEMAGLIVIALIVRAGPPRAAEGDRFRLFMVCYLLFRFLLDFLKPPHGPPIAGLLVPDSYVGLTAGQWVCLLGLVYYSGAIRRWILPPAHA
jgi:prolipoprotein diacylglyceryltransferase